jgi:exopolysaccharide biosynthesis operon protein EpsL
LTKINVVALLVVVSPIWGGVWSAHAVAAVEIVDPRDTLDKAVAEPDLIGGTAEDSFDLYVADRELYDSNVYRLSDGADIATLIGPTATKQDHINSPSVGLDGQWVLGRQIIDLVLRVDDNRFARNSNLNNVSTNDKLAWNWGLGDVLSGQVGVNYVRSLLSFVNAVVYTRNTYQQKEYFATARYQLGPRWTVYGGVLNTDVTVEEPATRANDSRRKSVDMGVEFVTNAADSLGLDYRYTDARYPNSVILSNTSFDPDYREDRLRILLKRTLSEKTTFDLNGGYLKRDYGNAIIGSFTGPIWRGSLGWQPTEKTQFILSTWRDLQAYLTDETNYYRSTGVSVSPVWIASEKISLSLLISWQDQNFIGSSPAQTNQTARRDTVSAQQASLVYTPTRALTFDVSYRHEKRGSNQPLRAYTDELASAGVKFAF